MYQCEPSAEADIDVLICWFGNVLIREASAEAETAGFGGGISFSDTVVVNQLVELMICNGLRVVWGRCDTLFIRWTVDVLILRFIIIE